jgi:hypothetical protein
MTFILDLYVKRWQQWAAAGLQGIKIVYDEQFRRCQQVPIQIALRLKALGPFQLALPRPLAHMMQGSQRTMNYSHPQRAQVTKRSIQKK